MEALRQRWFAAGRPEAAMILISLLLQSLMPAKHPALCSVSTRPLGEGCNTCESSSKSPGAKHRVCMIKLHRPINCALH
jgi:hypothetical protein